MELGIKLISIGCACVATVLGTAAMGQELAAETAGEMRERSTLVWRRQAELATVVLKVWDPAPGLGREFSWTPANPASLLDGNDDNGVTGSGRLVWREKGASDYDRSAIHTVYEGEISRGRAHGRGSEIRRDGTRYRGAWRDGQPHGDGEMLLSNGDEYQGAFRDGVYHGRGRYAAANGAIWSGQFDSGAFVSGEHPSAIGTLQRGRLSPVEGAQPDSEIVDTPPQGAMRTAQSSVPEVLFKVYTDRQRYLRATEDCFNCLAYDHRIIDRTVTITPGHPKHDVAGAWKGTGRINTSAVGDWTEWTIMPVFLVADVTNDSGTSLSIESGYLDVDVSAPDLKPFPLVSSTIIGDFPCGSGFELDDKIVVDNYGWSAVTNARTSLRFKDPAATRASRTVTVDLKSFSDFQTFKIFPVLEELGVRTDRLSTRTVRCSSVSQMPKCIRDVARSGIFGEIADHVFEMGNYAVTEMVGTLRYEWTDAWEKRHEVQSPFRVRVPVYGFVVPDMAECGAAGPIEYPGSQIELPVEREDYRISFDIPVGARVLRPRQNRRFALVIDSSKSALHWFKVVLQLSDGRRIASPPVVANILQWRTQKTYPDDAHFSIDPTRK